MSATADGGVVDAATRLCLRQNGTRVLGKYSGGSIARGVLVGRAAGGTLTFHYVQREAGGELHWGRSVCDLLERGDGRVRIVEHFRWHSRQGGGTNVFDEVPG